MRSTHLTVVQGTPFSVLVRVKRRNEQGENVPYELTGCAVILQAREKINSPTPFINLNSDNGGVVIDFAAGTFVIKMTAAQTRALGIGTASKYLYHCEVIPSDNENIRVLQGVLTVDRSVIR